MRIYIDNYQLHNVWPNIVCSKTEVMGKTMSGKVQEMWPKKLTPVFNFVKFDIILNKTNYLNKNKSFVEKKDY